MSRLVKFCKERKTEYQTNPPFYYLINQVIYSDFKCTYRNVFEDTSKSWRNYGIKLNGTIYDLQAII